MAARRRKAKSRTRKSAGRSRKPAKRTRKPAKRGRKAAKRRRGARRAAPRRKPAKGRRGARRRGARRRGARSRRRGVTVTLQIVPRAGDDLLALVKRWVEEEAQTLYFSARRPKLRLEHKSPRFRGYIELYRRGSLLFGEAKAPAGAAPWGVVEKFVGRVIDKLSGKVSSVNLQINAAE